MDISSGEILWSIPTGPPIYDAHQSPNLEDDEHNSSIQQNNFYVDCGDDWQLYIHDKNSKAEVPKKLSFSIEELIGKTPIVSPHGVLIGSKNTTVFLVDPETGDVIHTFKSDADFERSSIVVKKGAPEKWKEPNNFDHGRFIYLKRFDYNLKFISAITGKPLWSLSVADFDASRQCDGSTEILDVIKGDPVVHDFCQSPKVFRVRHLHDFEAIFKKPPMLVDGGKKYYLLPPDHESSLFAPAQLPESVLVNDPENPHQLVPYIPLIPHQPDDKHAKDVSVTHGILASIKMWVLELLAAALSIFIPLIVGCWNFGRRKQNKLNETVMGTKVQNVTPKKKKPRKSGNSRVDANTEKIMNGFQFTGSFERKIGKLMVSDKEIGKGSDGTVVLEGVYDGRHVAVKRIVKVHHDMASKEIQNLIVSDEHSNIVRWHGVEYDQDFVYIALERCICSLHELILPQTSSSTQVQSSMEVFKDFKLWKPNGYPSPELLKVMRDTASGLANLHELGIIHRDLKPQNVLIRKDMSGITAKVSDMGISKRLRADMSCLTKSATGYGSSGWQAPEQLRNEQQTRAVDLFSFGCVLFFCITGGRHPFGDTLERDVNIVNDRKDLFLIDSIPEAFDLITNLLHPIPEFRLKAAEVYHHPLFWDPELRLSFLKDASDRVELEDREPDSSILKALENIGTVALGGKWDEKLDNILLKDVTRYRKYKYDSIRDLLRVIRNKSNHYRELPKEVQEVLGSVPTGFESYFSSRFPKLLMEVYKVLKPFCAEEEVFFKYYKQGWC
ncbi:PUG domain-containing protein [Artemisia annua]|nr:PUG domain-containing protein [Artemisia annua]